MYILQIWECTSDLCDYIEENHEKFVGKSVLELGCGGALPSVLTAILGAKEVFVQDFVSFLRKSFNKKHRFFQNASVIEFFTLPNFEANEHNAKIESGAMAWEDVVEKMNGKK